MTKQMSGETNTGDRFVRLDDGDMHIREDGKKDAPAVLLIHGAAGGLAIWDPVVPLLADAFRVIRADLLGHGRSTTPAGGFDIATQARRVGAALDRLGVGRLMVVGHSTGCAVATALAEQRPGTVTALALIDMGPTPESKIPQRLLERLLLTRFPGRVLWRLYRLQSADGIRKALRAACVRPAEFPDAVVEGVVRTTHRSFTGTMRAPLDYIAQRSLTDRLAALDLPVLVVFGADDPRWRPSSAAAYRTVPRTRVEMLPGVGHIPMMEDPQATGTLLLDFAGR
ncbi:alpha/beta fold hydrolase [Nocardia sp. NPDC051030]|uniref:alpha/beta fold hydrolase n=1 Tax=Nocardia sp. NPDC051030 TaxID=3155162 RepID=UPI00341CEFB2